MSIMDFLYAWCRKRGSKLQYSMQSTGTEGNPQYTCKLTMSGCDYVGQGISASKNDALEFAAKDYVDYLRKKNIISDKEMPYEKPFGGPMPNLSSHGIWSRGILVLGAMAVVYFSSSKMGLKKEKPFALVTERIHHRSQEVTCSEEYKEELKSFVPGCIPKRCGRIVSDSMLSQDESEALMAVALKGFALNQRILRTGSLGAASILDLHSGALSRGSGGPSEFIDARKLPNAKELFGPHGIKVFRDLKNRMREAIRVHYSLGHDAGPSPYLTHPLFFSRLTSEEPVTVHDQYWLPHVDKETYESFHYTGLVYLNDYKKHFTGGRFIYIDTSNRPTNRTVEPKRGRVSIFTSGSENPHQVERVQSGVRYALTLSFTCNPEAAIQDISPSFILDS